jgi:20S proteasome subunit alpha 5
MDPSGTFVQVDAKAIGSGSEGAQQSLQEAYHKVLVSNPEHFPVLPS